MTVNPVTAETAAHKPSAPKPSAPRPTSHGAVPKPAPPRPAAPKPGPPKPTVPRQAQAPSGKRQAPAAAPGAPRITLVDATVETALDVADETVDKLIEQGTEPGSILVLTTGEAHPWQQHEETFGAGRYWRQYDEGKDVFYASLPASRPLRRETVVVVVNGFSDEAAADRTLASALTAGASVTVCGDLARVRALTGRD